MNNQMKFFLQSIGRYSESLTEKEANEILNAFTKAPAGFEMRNGYYGGLSSGSTGNIKIGTGDFAGSVMVTKNPFLSVINNDIQILLPGIQYKKISLFDAPKGSILVHACNAQGIWGSGIAKDFKSEFPKSFEQYNKYCTNNLPYHTSGTALVTEEENNYRVGCLITSSDFGGRLNAEKLILDNTKHALEKLAQTHPNSQVYYSNKFNSGFFKVPWEQTEKLIKDFVKKHNKTWIICDPNLEEIL